MTDEGHYQVYPDKPVLIYDDDTKYDENDLKQFSEKRTEQEYFLEESSDEEEEETHKIITPIIRITEEQQEIVDAIGTNNVIVDAIAGSGKTTTVLSIAKQHYKKSILLLTYNKKLELETKEKIMEQKLGNITVKTFHAFAYFAYKACIDDKGMIEIVNKNIKKKKAISVKFDIIIIDESQDITFIIYELLLKIIKDFQKESTTLCILGDRNQAIYIFKTADSRFITQADKVYSHCNNHEWVFKKLSMSFRITDPMSEFINTCILHKPRMNSCKPGSKVKYIVSNDYSTSNMINEIYLLLETYKPDDIFVLCPSVKSPNGFAKKLCNSIKLRFKNIDVYIPNSDEEVINSDIIKDKIVFSSFHQAKGLERECVIVYNFDESYYAFYNKSANPNICANELYVAITRAKSKLIVCHNNNTCPLSFVDLKVINKVCDLKYLHTYMPQPLKKRIVKMEYSVTELLNHVIQEILTECMDLMSFKTIRNAGEKIDIPHNTTYESNKSREAVSSITGTAIPIYYEYMLKNKISMSYLYNNHEITQDVLNFNPDIVGNKQLLNKLFTKKSINKIRYKIKNNVSLSISDVLFVACSMDTYKNGFFPKIKQIKKYNWITKYSLKDCINNMESLTDINKKSIFEQWLEILTDENVLIYGYCDCITKTNLYEFKTTEHLKDVHYIQCAIYGYLYSMEYNKKRKTVLYNILTDEYIEITVSNENMSKIINILLSEQHNNRGLITQNAFDESILKIKRRIIT